MRELNLGDWRGFQCADFPRESWALADGQLVALRTQSPVDLITRDEFGDFDLSFEWCVPEGGNSGVLYRVIEGYLEQSWESGPELQLLDDKRHPDGADPLKRCGALYDIMPPKPRPSPSAGVFHTSRIIALESVIEHWVDGIRVLTCDLASRGIRDRIASSKFAGLAHFGCAREGHIVLQHHGAGAAFRNIRIAY